MKPSATVLSEAAAREVAAAFGAEPEILPLLPELFAGVQTLGSFPERIVAVLREAADLSLGADPGVRPHVVDLGCGKGAVAVAIARDLGFRVRGIDLFPPFVEAAVAHAEEEGVAHLCRFEVGDLQRATEHGGIEAAARERGGIEPGAIPLDGIEPRRIEPAAYDVAVYAALGTGLFGDHADCIGALRRAVRPGGCLVINDGYLRGGERADYEGYEHYRSHEETLRQLTAHGDRLVREDVVPVSELQELDRRIGGCLRRNAGRLARRHPESAELLARYLESEEAECRFLESETVEAVWLLRRR